MAISCTLLPRWSVVERRVARVWRQFADILIMKITFNATRMIKRATRRRKNSHSRRHRHSVSLRPVYLIRTYTKRLKKWSIRFRWWMWRSRGWKFFKETCTCFREKGIPRKNNEKKKLVDEEENKCDLVYRCGLYGDMWESENEEIKIFSSR